MSPTDFDRRAEKLSEPRDVVVPVPGSSTLRSIHPGSGIVCEPWHDGETEKVRIHFEGNLYDAVNIKNFADRVLHAHGRQVTEYPTGAMRVVAASEVHQVGVYDPTHGRVDVTDEAALREWIGVETLDDGELLTTSGKGQRRRELDALLARHDLDPVTRQFALKQARRQGLR